MNKFFKYFPRAVASIILIETLLFKFGVGGEIFLKESQTLFENLTTGIFGHPEYEAYFRIGVGVLELIVAIVILTPRYAGIGALLGLILMLAAVTSHVFLIGIIRLSIDFELIYIDVHQLVWLFALIPIDFHRLFIDFRQSFFDVL